MGSAERSRRYVSGKNQAHARLTSAVIAMYTAIGQVLWYEANSQVEISGAGPEVMSRRVDRIKMNYPAASRGVSAQTEKPLVASHGELNPTRLKGQERPNE